jgi:hypothetical protein
LNNWQRSRCGSAGTRQENHNQYYKKDSFFH